MSVVIARDLYKRYSSLEAVRRISFDVRPGECYGLLGPNGAGKTSTMSMIRCVSPLTAGQLKVLGMDVAYHGREIRYRLGVVPQNDSLEPDLSVRDNLLVYASFFGIRGKEGRRRTDELLSFMALQEKADARLDQLSGGLRRRLLVARGLINTPELLILDEPTTGLDPQARHHIWQRLRSLKNAGTTMILCTHYMEEAESMCDRLGILDHGQLLAEDSPAALIAQHVGKEVLQLQMTPGISLPLLNQTLQRLLPQQTRQERFEDMLYCFSPPDCGFPLELLDELHRQQFPLTIRRACLEDVFLKLTGRELRQ